jgi:hypothetical protein
MSNELQRTEQPEHEIAESEKATAKKKPPMVKLAKGFKRAKSLAKYTGAAVVVAGGIAIAVPFLGALMIFSLAIGAVAFIATMVIAVKFIREKAPPEVVPFMNKAAQVVSEAAKTAGGESASEKTAESKANEKKSAKQSSSGQAGSAPSGTAQQEEVRIYKLWDIEGHVYIYSDEPTVQDLIKSRTDSAGLLAVMNGTRVKVVLDEKNEAVFVELLDGDAKGKQGWVCRSCLAPTDERVAAS